MERAVAGPVRALPALPTRSGAPSRAAQRRPGDELLAAQRTHGNRCVQRLVAARAATVTGAAEVRDASARGVLGPGGTLPHLDRIQAAFGGHDVSGVRAHVGGPAAEASDRLGAVAYATGTDVAFATEPDVRTAAHEAAHVVQQRHGERPAGAFGGPADPLERHADAVAEAVVAGRDAATLLGHPARAGAGGAGRTGRPVQALLIKVGSREVPAGQSFGPPAT